MFYDPYDDEVPLDADTDRRNVLIAKACVALAVLVVCVAALVVLQ